MRISVNGFATLVNVLGCHGGGFKICSRNDHRLVARLCVGGGAGCNFNLTGVVANIGGYCFMNSCLQIVSHVNRYLLAVIVSSCQECHRRGLQ